MLAHLLHLLPHVVLHFLLCLVFVSFAHEDTVDVLDAVAGRLALARVELAAPLLLFIVDALHTLREISVRKAL